MTAPEAARLRRNALLRERRRLERLHRYEDAARARGVRRVAGIDEVGRGPLAGPVVAACVVLDGPLRLHGLADSKRVRPELRETLAREIKARAVGWAIGESSVDEIAERNIFRATLLAMERALAALPAPPEYLLVDALRIATFPGEQEAVVGGDALCASIAAASIVAKVHRDALLRELDARFPHYGFGEHKGYGTPRHLAALAEHGPCEAHRRGFAPVARLLARPGANA